MNKMITSAIAIAIGSFLACNLILLFSSKSVIPKSVYITDSERMTTGDYKEKLAKEGLVAPMDTYTVYVGNEDIVDTWSVKEGDHVSPGQEIATLQTARAEGQRAIWEAEREALMTQKSTVISLLNTLESERQSAKSDSSSNVNRTDNASKSNEDTNVEVGMNVDVQVDVKQDGPYAQAIAAADQELADIERQLVVVETQLAQNPSSPALISPVDGIVSNVTRLGPTLAIDIFSTQKVIVTYAKNNEWQRITEGDEVLVQGGGIGQAVKGSVLSVSQTPAADDKWLGAYKTLDTGKVKNPLAYHEVRILTDSGLEPVPYGTDMNAIVIVNEALDAISVREKWLIDPLDGTAGIRKINSEGRAEKVEVITPFTWKTRAIITQGLQVGDVVVHEPKLWRYDETPQLFLPLPTDFPKKEDWKKFGWRNYVKYSIVK